MDFSCKLQEKFMFWRFVLHPFNLP